LSSLISVKGRLPVDLNAICNYNIPINPLDWNQWRVCYVLHKMRLSHGRFRKRMSELRNHHEQRAKP